MSTAKREKIKNKKPSAWLENCLTWLSKQQQKWYGFILNIFGLPLLFVFALISWPVRYIVCYVKGITEND